MPTTRRRIAVNLSESEFSVLAELAGKHDVSLAWLGRHAILDFLERYRGGEQLDLPLRSSASRPAALMEFGKEGDRGAI